MPSSVFLIERYATCRRLSSVHLVSARIGFAVQTVIEPWEDPSAFGALESVRRERESKSIESRGVIHQDGLAQSRIGNPPR